MTRALIFALAAARIEIPVWNKPPPASLRSEGDLKGKVAEPSVEPTLAPVSPRESPEMRDALLDFFQGQRTYDAHLSVELGSPFYAKALRTAGVEVPCEADTCPGTSAPEWAVSFEEPVPAAQLDAVTAPLLRATRGAILVWSPTAAGKDLVTVQDVVTALYLHGFSADKPKTDFFHDRRYPGAEYLANSTMVFRPSGAAPARHAGSALQTADPPAAIYMAQMVRTFIMNQAQNWNVVEINDVSTGGGMYTTGVAASAIGVHCYDATASADTTSPRTCGHVDLTTPLGTGANNTFTQGSTTIHPHEWVVAIEDFSGVSSGVTTFVNNLVQIATHGAVVSWPLAQQTGLISQFNMHNWHVDDSKTEVFQIKTYVSSGPDFSRHGSTPALVFLKDLWAGGNSNSTYTVPTSTATSSTSTSTNATTTASTAATTTTASTTYVSAAAATTAAMAHHTAATTTATSTAGTTTATSTAAV